MSCASRWDHNRVPEYCFSGCPVLVKDVTPAQLVAGAGHSKGESELPLVTLSPVYTVLVLCFSPTSLGGPPNQPRGPRARPAATPAALLPEDGSLVSALLPSSPWLPGVCTLSALAFTVLQTLSLLMEPLAQPSP